MKTEAPAVQENKELTVKTKNISSQVLQRVQKIQETGGLTLPKDYSAENALASAYLILSDPKNNILEKCDQNSVAEALYKMVVWGVTPAKKQCYFIPYGNKLECSISYNGNIAAAKRYGNLKTIRGVVIYKTDDFQFEVEVSTGKKKLLNHKQTLESLDGEIVGAYAVKEFNDGTFETEIMTMKQIQSAWAQGGSKGNSPAHKNFADQMAIKTVINRALKIVIASSDDSAILETTGDILEEKTIDVADENVAHEIKTNANKTSFGFPVEDAQILEEEKPTQKTPTATADEAFEKPEVLAKAVAEEKTGTPKLNF